MPAQHRGLSNLALGTGLPEAWSWLSKGSEASSTSELATGSSIAAVGTCSLVTKCEFTRTSNLIVLVGELEIRAFRPAGLDESKT